MKCPSCGNEIQEGKLYCEICGKELKIVPDFEPEIEYSMDKTLSGIVDDVFEKDGHDNTTKKGSGKINVWMLIGIAVVILCLGAIVVKVGISNKQSVSASYQLQKASDYYNAGKNKLAIKHYVNAYELDKSNISILLVLADLYMDMGYDLDAIQCYKKVIDSEYAVKSELVGAYKGLVAYYEKQNKLEEIKALLKNCSQDIVQDNFRRFMAEMPKFSHEEGSYEDVIALKLISNIKGTIYFTTDGSIPSTNSLVYTSPIYLKSGIHKISAIFVNEYGVVSDVAVNEYDIAFLPPTTPEISIESGVYTDPEMIQVLSPLDAYIYYTIDGSIPTNESILYTTAIPMPIGVSVFNFVAYSFDGLPSEVVTLNLELTLQMETTPSQAVNKLMYVLVDNGRIINTDGKISETNQGRYLYMYRGVMPVSDDGYYYVVEELYENSTGGQSATGMLYGIHIDTLECYRIVEENLGEYILEKIQSTQ